MKPRYIFDPVREKSLAIQLTLHLQDTPKIQLLIHSIGMFLLSGVDFLALENVVHPIMKIGGVMLLIRECNLHYKFFEIQRNQISPCPEPDIALFTTKFCSYEWSDSVSPEKVTGLTRVSSIVNTCQTSIRK